MQILAERTGRAQVEDGTHAYELSKKGMSSCKFKLRAGKERQAGSMIFFLQRQK